MPGAQTCLSDGSGFGECLGCPGGTDAATDATTDGGEGGSDSGGSSADSAADTREDSTPVPATYVYVLSTITTSPSTADPMEGFNVDGLFSTASDANGCDHADNHSVLDPDQNEGGCVFGDGGACQGGVDNQLGSFEDTLASVTGTDLRAQLSAMVSSGTYVLLLRLTGVTSLVDDSSVTASLLLGYPNFSTSCSPVTAGRSYLVATSSLSGATIDTALLQAQGSIHSGRLDATFPATAALPLPLGPITASVLGTRLRVDLAATQATNGNFGGWVDGTALTNAVVAFAPAYTAQIETVMGGLVDVQAAGVCYTAGSPPAYGDMSVGFAFQALPATIPATSNTESSPAPGTCGATD